MRCHREKSQDGPVNESQAEIIRLAATPLCACVNILARSATSSLTADVARVVMVQQALYQIDTAAAVAAATPPLHRPRNSRRKRGSESGNGSESTRGSQSRADRVGAEGAAILITHTARWMQ